MNFQAFKQKQPTIMLFFITLLLAVFLSSCGSSRSVENRIIHADSILFGSELTPLPIKTPYFALHSAYSFPEPEGLLTVYIEGDGRSWVSRFQLSSNPTPINPVALNLAIIHANNSPNTNIAWLARPCQYLPAKGDVNCESKYWSSHRFAEQVISATNIAIDQLMQKSSAKTVRLIGFSGGAAVAVLAAARRADVDSIVTIAGNLDHRQVNAHHKVTPLIGSLNPKDVAKQLGIVPQVHFIGNNDKIIPIDISADFINVQNAKCAEQIIVPGAGHIEGWPSYWYKAVDELDANLSCSKLSISF